ncbi:MAG: radical SAM protein [Thermoplasmata archaeon]
MLISDALGLCADCIKGRPEEALPIALGAHAESRRRFGLPPHPPGRPLPFTRARPAGGQPGPPPAAPGLSGVSGASGVPGAMEPPSHPDHARKVRCTLCANECAMAGGERGYCGLRENRGGRLRHIAGTPIRGIVSAYYDPLPTNCVATDFCAGGSGAGYPRYAHYNGPERGYKNLAVFYGACSFDCLFCQNWHFRYMIERREAMSAEELAAMVDEKTSCICYFGGDPTPQMPHALAASRIALESARGILRICWETNGSMSPALLKKAAELSLRTGGTIKFDLKAWDENLHIALCGVSNRRTLENFRTVASMAVERPEPPLLTASTLLVPGYIGVEEVDALARFIASLDPSIPYSLLAFHPDFEMSDLPTTSRDEAMGCLEAAKSHLKRVRVGNLHLLS